MDNVEQHDIIAFGPASVANVGPCYDVLGYCIDHIGDFVRATRTDAHQEVRLVEVIDLLNTGINRLPFADNCAQIVASEIFEEFHERMSGKKCGIDLTLYKAMPVRSGLGSSSASIAATAKAMFAVMGINDGELEFKQIARPLISAENRVTGGHYHLDNIIPSYFGGFNIISRESYDSVEVDDFFTVILWQDIQLDTAAQRNIINEFLESRVLSAPINARHKSDMVLAYMRYQAYCAARIIYGLSTGDLKMVGEAIGSKSEPEYNLLEQARIETINKFSEIRHAAIDAGAYGCAICGSGPSIFAITDSMQNANEIKAAMMHVVEGTNARWLISSLNKMGAQIIENPAEWIERHRTNHSFWDSIDTGNFKQ